MSDFTCDAQHICGAPPTFCEVVASAVSRSIVGMLVHVSCVDILVTYFCNQYRKERRCMVQAMENETLTRMTPLYWPTTERSAKAKAEARPLAASQYVLMLFPRLCTHQRYRRTVRAVIVITTLFSNKNIYPKPSTTCSTAPTELAAPLVTNSICAHRKRSYRIIAIL